MKFKLCALLSIATFALTACNGGGNDNTVALNQPIKPIANNNQPFGLNEQIVVWKNAEKEQYSGEVTMNDSPKKYAGQDGNDNKALTQINIDGRIVSLDPSFTYTHANGSWLDGVTGDMEAETVTVGANTAYTRYGFIRMKYSGDLALFYQGQPTSLDDMKQLEKQANDVTYKGQAFAITQGNYNIFHTPAWLTGNSQFTVNIKNKTLKGTVDQWHDYVAFAGSQVDKAVSSVKPVEIEAQIRANTFAGTANKTGTVEGKFYGSNAANLAGAFHDKEQKLRGVFGAVKK